MTTCSVEEAASAKERLLLWGSLAVCALLAVACVILLFSVRTAVAERDYAYARADSAEAKSTQESMRAAGLDVKLNAKQVQLQLATDQLAQMRSEMLAKEQAFMQGQGRVGQRPCDAGARDARPGARRNKFQLLGRQQPGWRVHQCFCQRPDRDRRPCHRYATGSRHTLRSTFPPAAARNLAPAKAGSSRVATTSRRSVADMKHCD